MTSREVFVNAVPFSLREEALQVLLVPALWGLVPGLGGLVPGLVPVPGGPGSGAGQWELPGGALVESESLEETADRVLTGLIDRRETYLEQLYTYGGAQRPAVSVVYFVLVPAEARLGPGGRARWFPVTVLPGLCGDHAEILAYALRRLRYKLEYSAVGFQLLPSVFTLSELQHTYEIILDERLDKRNFRRRILGSGIIEPTAQRRLGEGRPARLYRYRPDAVAEVKARRLFP
jgi:8-oxo-dGTP diphosphatase